jgi:hypothetical protein
MEERRVVGRLSAVARSATTISCNSLDVRVGEQLPDGQIGLGQQQHRRLVVAVAQGDDGKVEQQHETVGRCVGGLVGHARPASVTRTKAGFASRIWGVVIVSTGFLSGVVSCRDRSRGLSPLKRSPGRGIACRSTGDAKGRGQRASGTYGAFPRARTNRSGPRRRAWGSRGRKAASEATLRHLPDKSEVGIITLCDPNKTVQLLCSNIKARPNPRAPTCRLFRADVRAE